MRKPIGPMRGWDWTEMLMIWEGGDKISSGCEHDQAEWIRLHLRRLMEASCGAWGKDRPTRAERTQIHLCRGFVKKLGQKKQKHHYDAEVFLAIAAIKNDYTFIQWLDHYLEWSWS